MKNIGILLPIFALPTKYGIGDFGPSAYQFIDILKDNNLKYWEVLPINPTDNSNSPYSTASSLAINPLFISIDDLISLKLLTETYSIEVSSKIDYQKIKIKDKYLRIAFNNLKNNNNLYLEYLDYIKNENEYAKFMALKIKNNNDSWINFKDDYDLEEYNYQMFLQFIAQREWFNLKKYANNNNIEIIGDLPIYPSYESSDLYFHHHEFILNDNKMEFVSGASPDYFNCEGQKWGHPLYDFEYQRNNNYKYMLNKYLYVDSLFDIIRIDHFKAFDAYFKIPINKSPKSGTWIKSNGDLMLEYIFKFVNPNKYIVEDLGTDLNDLYILRDKYNLPGMKIFEYTFDFKNKSEFEDSSNMIVYPGNHDNNTIVGWYNGLNVDNKKVLDDFLVNYSGEINEKIIKYLMDKPYKYLIILIQDILGQNEEYRINKPGIADGQWNYRLESFDNIDQNLKKLFNT